MVLARAGRQTGGSTMFKMGLRTSTAMTAVALLLSGADAAQARTAMHVVNRDANARFLCTYGHFTVRFASNQQSGFFSSGWSDVAVPVVGHGQTVSSIKVMEAQSRFTNTSRFSAGIYSNSRFGRPGKLIAGGTGRAVGPSSSCGPVTVSITPTTLKPNTKYWIEETPEPSRNGGSIIELYWYANPKAKHEAFVRTHSRTCSSGSCSHHTSKWKKQSMGPWFKLR